MSHYIYYWQNQFFNPLFSSEENNVMHLFMMRRIETAKATFLSRVRSFKQKLFLDRFDYCNNIYENKDKIESHQHFYEKKKQSLSIECFEHF